MKVIDSFSFFNEFNILKLRLYYLNDIVDNFIISESNYTYSGKPKPYYLDQVINDIPKEIREKIIRIKYTPNINDLSFSDNVTEFDYSNSNWKLEREQRNLISKNLFNFSNNDLIMISDVDEIPRKEVIRDLISKSIKQNFSYVSSSEMFYYNFTTFCIDNWAGTVFANVGNVIQKGCDYFRTNRIKLSPIEKGGWHFTYFGGVEQIKYKIDSFAHQEYNKELYKTDENIIDAIRNKRDLLMRGSNFSDTTSGDEFKEYEFSNFPEELQDSIKKVYSLEYYSPMSDDNMKCFIQKKMINVCFSTIPTRFCGLEKIIESFKNQTLVPDKIIITVPEKYHRFSYDKSDIEKICSKYSNFVHLLYVDNDYGPATKIYGSLKSLELYPESSVIVGDDDVIYDERLVKCYEKALITNGDCVWTTAKTNENNANDLTFPNIKIHKLQGVDTYLFSQKILEKINTENFESLYFNFLIKNTDIKDLSDVFLHDDYFVSLLLYEQRIPISSFYLKHTVYEGMVAENQIHESLKCHSDEAKLLQRVYKNYVNSDAIIRCVFTTVNGEKVGEFLIDGELNEKEYHEYIINIHNNYGPFKIQINVDLENQMNSLLDRKTTDIQEYYDWQIKYSKMPDDHVDYLFKLKYWNNFHPKVIYDIGSNYLSWYNLASNVWRNAKIYCFDAFSGFEDVYPRYDIEYSIDLLSDCEKQVEFYENRMCPGLCSVYPVNQKYELGNQFYNEHLEKVVRTTKTLDSLIREKKWSKPDLIKMDVQGSEVDILKGASEILENCNHLILEIQFKDFSMGAPKLKEVEEYLNSIGFVLFHKIGEFSDLHHDGDYHFVRKTILPT